MQRFVGIDVGAETIKLAEVVRERGALRVVRRQLAGHGKDPGAKLVELLELWEWDRVESAAVTGRLGRRVALERIPTKEALLAGARFVHGSGPATLVTIGSRGFAVLEIRASGSPVYRENSRCAQGTGNFLRQLVERFDLEVDEAARLAEGVEDPAPLSGRCPVILKTDLTHLANKGERKERLVAGLLDAIAENVEVLVKPRLSPPRVLLAGGVTQALRVREHFRRFLSRHGMTLVETERDETLFLEAIGCAVHAAEQGAHVTSLGRLIRPPPDAFLEELPPLADSMRSVRRMRRSSTPSPRATPLGREGGPVVASAPPVILGFDVGSTGSKAVALDAARGEPLWEGYLRTNGAPVFAAQALMTEFLDSPVGAHPVMAVGATGSGREIVGSLLATCFGAESVFVLNEIAAHARGALQHDPRVDTIFEIGGQDAKYIRLAEGRVVDAAMNEACSAGTGSFIEEQGRRFEGVEDVARLGRVAMQADRGVSLGQHCSVFMAEVIDEAVAAGIERGPIVAGIYASVVANYLNRVKGSRSVGQVVFCQGMPFSADALAAAVAQQTGAEVIVPPSPGTVGALGIALLAAEAIPWEKAAPLDARRFLEARLEKKDVFVCTSNVGCGGASNRCRIDRLTTVVEGERQKFTWGGACSLHDKGTRKKKLPDRAPHPFREREELVEALVARLSGRRGGKRIALTDEFQLKGLFPFFATFLHGLGLDLDVARGADRAALKRGIEGANVPFCAPMQQHHGLVQAMAEREPDLLFLPMVRSIPRAADEPYSKTCPVAGGCPDILRADLGADQTARIVSPIVDVDAGGLEGETFARACRRLAADVGGRGSAFQRAFAAARATQLEFEAKLLDIGRAALTRCEAEGLLPIVVLGRDYTIHNDVLNSNVPAILREQGAVAIPVDCYPVAGDVPRFPNMYWAHGQRLLRAAWQVRRTPGVYSLFASNYSCGPDSFTLHFYRYLMEGKPFVVIETDGHSGDAGTKTRVEAFLHCVREDLREARPSAATDEARLTVRVSGMRAVIRSGERVLLPRMGPGTDIVAATLRGAGIDAEALPDPTPETLRLGRRHTSGKECLPAALTLGSLLERLERERGTDRRFVLFMPSAEGPCRFGAYKELDQLVLDHLGWSDRVRIWAPPSRNYFEGMQPGLKAVLFAGVSASDRLRDMLCDIRPGESRPGAAEALFARWVGELEAAVERIAGSEDLSASRVLIEALTGGAWGIPELVSRAAREFAAVRGARDLPVVLVAGEIYVRNVPFSNGTIVDALARRGIRSRVAGVTEYLQYSDWNATQNGEHGLSDRLSSWVRRRIDTAVHDAAAHPLGWAPSPPTSALVAASRPYLRGALEGEAVLTIGAPLHAWRHREIDAAVLVGPLECMPNKVAESQFNHVAERDGLLSLTLSLNGEPIDPEILDAFAFEVHTRFRTRAEGARPPPAPGSWIARLEEAIDARPAAEDTR